jgi:putative inorganic carbon (HCO3(-)) transporter
MLCPVAVLAFRRRRRLRSKAFTFVLLAWVAGFAYATFLATAYGMFLQALYGLGQFGLPATVGVWLMTREESMEVAHARLARALLLFGAIAAAYGVLQYVVAPPWDTAWMQKIQADSFGEPERFGIRVFGVLNSPGTFGLFIGSLIVFTLPYLRVRSWYNVAALFVMTIALILSQVRTAWLAVVVGIVVCVWLSPKRMQAVLSLSATALLCGIGAFLIAFALPEANVSDKTAQRFATLYDVQDDGSAAERRQTTELAVQRALDAPAGSGLGLTGQNGQLGSADSQVLHRAPGRIDNGFAARFLEMGIPGFLGFMIASCASIVILIRRYAQLARARNHAGMRVGASCIAAQVVIFAVNLSGDGQQGLLGVLFFAALALPLMTAQSTVDGAVSGSKRRSNPIGFTRGPAFE